MALYNTGKIGDAIFQPSCGNAQDTVANLTRFIPLSTSGNNSVDAAIAKVVSGQVNTSDSILGIGSVSKTTGCILHGFVQKQGAGSGLTNGQVLACVFNVFITDSCTNTQYAFVNQIETSFSSPLAASDSGSLLVTEGTPQAMGLIFASNGNIAYANPISTVLRAFNVTIAAPTGTLAPSPTAGPEAAPSIEQLEAEGVVSKYSSDLMKIPGVWGVGASAYPDGHMYIAVHLEAISLEIKAKVPTTLGGFPVEFVIAPAPHFL